MMSICNYISFFLRFEHPNHKSGITSHKRGSKKVVKKRTRKYHQKDPFTTGLSDNGPRTFLTPLLPLFFAPHFLNLTRDMWFGCPKRKKVESHQNSQQKGALGDIAHWSLEAGGEFYSATQNCVLLWLSPSKFATKRCTGRRCELKLGGGWRISFCNVKLRFPEVKKLRDPFQCGVGFDCLSLWITRIFFFFFSPLTRSEILYYTLRH